MCIKKIIDFTLYFRLILDIHLSIIECQYCRPRRVWRNLLSTNTNELLVFGAAGAAYQIAYHWHRDKVHTEVDKITIILSKAHNRDGNQSEKCKF